MDTLGKKKKPFWDVEENKGFVSVEAKDGLVYKVWNEGKPETIQKVANILADTRYAVNQLLICLFNNKDKWEEHPIAYGIYHTFNIHAPGSDESVFTAEDANNLINKRAGKDLFNYQEMTPNKHGILGLNKPKELTYIPVTLENGQVKYYEIAKKRSIFLTIRPQLSDNGDPNVFDKPKNIIDLIIHEASHTTCNDTQWKVDNHKKPYPEYHDMMKQFARECGIYSLFLN